MANAELYAQLCSTFQRYHDVNDIRDKIRPLGDIEAVVTELWEVFRTWEVPIGGKSHHWYAFHGAPNAWDAEDFLEFLRRISAVYPKGWDARYQQLCTESSEVPGRLWIVFKLLDEKKNDAEFTAILQQRWQEIDEPFVVFVGLVLVTQGHLSWEQLPQEHRQQIARASLKYQPYSTRDLAIDPKTWAQEMFAVAQSDEAFCYSKLTVLLKMRPHITPAEFVSLFARCNMSSDTQQGLLELFEQGGDFSDLIEPLEVILATTTIEAIPMNGWDKVAPGFTLALVYLLACQTSDHIPLASLDPLFQDLVEHFKLGFSGGREEDVFLMLQRCISAIPDERLEVILTATDTFPWSFVAGCGTPTVLQAIADQLKALPADKGGDYHLRQLLERIEGHDYYKYRDSLLFNQREALVPYFSDLLCGKPFPQRKIALRILSFTNKPEAAPGYAARIGDSAKGIRELALTLLKRLPKDSYLDSLAVPLHGSKPAREAAAKLLVTFSPNAKAYALAQARIPKERTASIKALLQTIKDAQGSNAKQDNKEARAREAIDALTNSKGKAWEDYTDLGTALIDVYWDYLAVQYEDDGISSLSHEYKTLLEYNREEYYPYAYWLAVLERFGTAAPPKTQRRILKLATCMYSSDSNKYWKKLQSSMPWFRDAMRSWLLEEEVKRPPSFGKFHRYMGQKEAMQWLLGNEPIPEVFLHLLGDRRKTIAAQAQRALVFMGADAAETLEQALTHKKNKIRVIAAQVLGELQLERSLPALEKSAAQETDWSVQSAVQSAITAIRANALDPSLFAADAKGDAQLDEALCNAPAHPVPFSSDSDLPSLQWKSGAPLSNEANTWVLGQATKEDLEHRSEVLAQVRERLDDARCHALCEAVLHGRSNTVEGWPLYFQSIFGSLAQIDHIASQLDQLASSQNTKWGSDGVEALVRHGSDAALRHLQHSWKKSRRDALRRRAGYALERTAQQRGLTLEELLDSIVSDFGFSPQREQALPYGGRSLTLKLNDQCQIEVYSDEGKLLPSMPRARKSDDAAEIEAAKKHVARLKRELKSVAKPLLKNLERAMAIGRTWNTAQWNHQFVQHPVRNILSQGLIFEAHNAGGTSRGTFQLQLDNKLVNHAGEPFSLPDDATVCILHPIHLSEEQRKAWETALNARSVSQPFAQLQRRTFRVEELPESDALFFRNFPMAKAGPFMRGVRTASYERGSREDAGMIYAAHRDLGPYAITMPHTPYHPEHFEVSSDVEFNKITVKKDNTEIPWRELPKALLSELVLDMHALMNL